MSRAAYLLFYRRRSPVPLGPPSLQQIVTADSSPDSDSDGSASEPRSRSPAGNGLRLGDSSRNGSSSAGAVAAGVGALRAAGSQLSAAASHPRNADAAAAGVLNLSTNHNSNDIDDDDDEMDTLPPPYPASDEGFHDATDGDYVSEMYAPLNSYTDDPVWSFQSLGDGTGNGGNSSRVHQRGFSNDDDDDEDVDAASDAPNLGSVNGGDGGEELSNRLLEDFGDDEEEVAEIRLRGD